MSDWITKAFYYVRAFIDGSLSRCQGCGVLTEVLEFGQQFNLHFDAMSRGRDIPRPMLIPGIAKLRLCINCHGTIAHKLNLHVDCCARRPYLRIVR